MDYASIPVPETCYADFCLIPVRPSLLLLQNTQEHQPHSLSASAPMARAQLSNLRPWLGDGLGETQVGTGNVSVAEEVAEVQRLLRASGVKHTMHSAGTTVGRPSPQMPQTHLTCTHKHQKLSLSLPLICRPAPPEISKLHRRVP